MRPSACRKQAFPVKLRAGHARPSKTQENKRCFLTTELDKLAATDWQPFFAAERAKPYFAELDAFVTAAAAEKDRLPCRAEHLCSVPRLPGIGGAVRDSGGRTPTMSRGRRWG